MNPTNIDPMTRAPSALALALEWNTLPRRFRARMLASQDPKVASEIRILARSCSQLSTDSLARVFSHSR